MRKALARTFLFTLNEWSRGNGRERHAASGPMRNARRADARPAGALLTPRLRPGAGDFAAALRLGRALPAGGQFASHYLVQQPYVGLRFDQAIRQGVLSHRGTGGIYLGYRRHVTYPLTTTREPVLPGTAPFTSSRLRSLSVATTVRPTWVIFLFPI